MDTFWDESGLLWHYLEDRLDADLHPFNGGFIHMDKGEMVAAVGVYDLKDVGQSRMATIAGATESPKWFTRTVFKRMHKMLFSDRPEGLGLSRLNSFVQVSNEHSVAVTERIGFKREGIMRKAGPEGDDIVVFGLLRDDLPDYLRPDDKPAPVADIAAT